MNWVVNRLPFVVVWWIADTFCCVVNRWHFLLCGESLTLFVVWWITHTFCCVVNRSHFLLCGELLTLFVVRWVAHIPSMWWSILPLCGQSSNSQIEPCQRNVSLTVLSHSIRSFHLFRCVLMYGVWHTWLPYSGAGWDFFPQRVLDRRGFRPSHTSAIAAMQDLIFMVLVFLTIEKWKTTVKCLAVPEFLEILLSKYRLACLK